jgi:hypothetical protein
LVKNRKNTYFPVSYFVHKFNRDCCKLRSYLQVIYILYFNWISYIFLIFYLFFFIYFGTLLFYQYLWYKFINNIINNFAHHLYLWKSTTRTCRAKKYLPVMCHLLRSSTSVKKSMLLPPNFLWFSQKYQSKSD